MACDLPVVYVPGVRPNQSDLAWPPAFDLEKHFPALFVGDKLGVGNGCVALLQLDVRKILLGS